MTAADVEQLASQTLDAHDALFLATSGPGGPWINGVYFTATGLHRLVLVLEERGRTLGAIRHDPHVAVIVSTGSPADPFLQGAGTAAVLEDAEAEEARRALVEAVPAAAPFLDAPISTMAITLDEWRVTDIPHGWLPGRRLPRAG